MPRKLRELIRELEKNAFINQVRELIRELEKNAFINRDGKGSHRNFIHQSGVRITLSGNLSDDAKPYQEREVKKKI
jgi:predicted RNA binding protein YcfA (HicA-like mRNA interferase family)